MENAYTKSGVDIAKAENALSSVSKLIQSTYNKAVISPPNGFAALYEIQGNQVLASATDGVGTKLDIAIEMGNNKTIGIDLVAMVVNDLAVYGIRPLFFLDYLATGKVDPAVFTEVVEGIVDGCKQAGCALIGGETAEMPGFYPDNKYDLAGFAVGLAHKDDLIMGEQIRPGDVIIGLSSSGLHSNGFSLVRKIIKDNNLSLGMNLGSQTLGEALLAPTVIYTEAIQNLKKVVGIKGLAHITGGGFENITRVLPAQTTAVINVGSWSKPEIFDFIQNQGQIKDEEIYNIFNMGIGMVAIVDENQAEQAIKAIEENGHSSFHIGQIEANQTSTNKVGEIRLQK